MAQLVRKLNLNKTPQLVDPNSLIYAKNIKLGENGNIGADAAVKNILRVNSYAEGSILGHIVGLNNKIYFFIQVPVNNESVEEKIETVSELNDSENSFVEDPEFNYNNIETKAVIIEYDEINETINELKTAWTYSGGEITGVVTMNNTNELILTICEYKEDDDSFNVPIKHLNLSHVSETDDESIYTQHPNIPISNLFLTDTYITNIPNGVYQFFIRYKIRKGFYTNWFPCSKDCYSGTKETIDTLQGSVRFVRTTRDSGKSFVFTINHLFDEYKSNFKEFQLGFIISNDDTTVARSWKSFNFDVNKIYFDYKESDIKEINIDDMLNVNYELFNVKNITYFKNKLYISNYKETNFNEDFTDLAKEIFIDIGRVPIDDDSHDVYIEGRPLRKSNPSLPYYDLWSSSPIKDILNERKTLNVIQNTTKGGTYKSKGTDKHFWKLNAYFAPSVNPDVYWVREGSTDVYFNNKQENNLKLPFAFKASDVNVWYNNTSWFYVNKYNDLYSGIYPTNSRHPLQEDYTKNKWFFYSNSNGDPAQIPVSSASELCYNKGFTKSNPNPYTNMANTIKDAVLARKEITDNKYICSSIYVKDDQDNNIYIVGGGTELNSPVNFTGLKLESTNKEHLDNIIFGQLESKIKGIDANGYLYLEINGNIVKVENIFITYSELKYEGSINNISNQSGSLPQEDEIIIDVARTNYTVSYNISAKINDDGGFIAREQNTLMPFSNYKFFIHYVKNNGIITNGYPIATIDTSYIGSGEWEDYDEEENKDYAYRLYPKFTNIKFPKDYNACFISLYNVGDLIAKGFNLYHDEERGEYQLYCLEIDSYLYNIRNNITVINGHGKQVITNKAEYYGSGTTKPINMFGNTGCICWKDGDVQNIIEDVNNIWVIVHKQNEADFDEATDLNLIKITPYIKKSDSDTTSYDNYDNLNLPSFICSVVKPLKESNNIYVSGNDVYSKNFSSSSTVELTALNSFITIKHENTQYIHSNFNLNYLTLREINNITPQIRSWQEEGEGGAKGKQMIVGLQSATISDIYELPNMYKDFIRKFFNTYETDTINIFNNTIRSSDGLSDENYKNIYNFKNIDYYNVPVNKGKIVNLFSITDNIYIHTEHSLFKFTGKNSLTSEEGEISLKEGEVFDTGISEIFDAQYGYAGISKKHHSLITFDSYIFYDSYTNKIYAFGGNAQISCISLDIQHILNYYNISDVKFVLDDFNNRFFVNFIINDQNICLSFNMILKNFISIHDINFEKGFHTRSNTYFIYDDTEQLNKTVYKISKTEINNYDKMLTKSILSIKDEEDFENELVSCIDVICNENYEIIKTLDWINWICSNIKSNSFTQYESNFIAEEDLDAKYSGTKLRIYSDQCCTALIDLCDENGEPYVQNNQTITNPNSYTYPRYNCGVWSLNYFRDVKNTDDIFNYGGSGSLQDKSLIYGKYFVFRLIFKNKNFKFENIKFNMNNYGKA